MLPKNFHQKWMDPAEVRVEAKLYCSNSEYSLLEQYNSEILQKAMTTADNSGKANNGC